MRRPQMTGLRWLQGERGGCAGAGAEARTSHRAGGAVRRGERPRVQNYILLEEKILIIIKY